MNYYDGPRIQPEPSQILRQALADAGLRCPVYEDPFSNRSPSHSSYDWLLTPLPLIYLCALPEQTSQRVLDKTKNAILGGHTEAEDLADRLCLNPPNLLHAGANLFLARFAPLHGELALRVYDLPYHPLGFVGTRPPQQASDVLRPAPTPCGRHPCR